MCSEEYEPILSIPAAQERFSIKLNEMYELFSNLPEITMPKTLNEIADRLLIISTKIEALNEVLRCAILCKSLEEFNI